MFKQPEGSKMFKFSLEKIRQMFSWDKFGDKFGRCMYCMRASFRLALYFSIFGILFVYIERSAFSFAIASAVALTTTILWLTHVLAFSIRKARLSAMEKESFESNDRVAENLTLRRQMVPLFIRYAIGISLASALPKMALAYSNYSYNDQQACRYQGPGYHYMCCETGGYSPNQVCNCYPSFITDCNQAGYYD